MSRRHSGSKSVQHSMVESCRHEIRMKEDWTAWFFSIPSCTLSERCFCVGSLGLVALRAVSKLYCRDIPQQSRKYIRAFPRVSSRHTRLNGECHNGTPAEVKVSGLATLGFDSYYYGRLLRTTWRSSKRPSGSAICATRCSRGTSWSPAYAI